MENTHFLFFVFSAFIFLTSCGNKQAQKTKRTTDTISIAFGSCAKENKPQPMLEIAAKMNLDAFIFLGDNIYGDSRIMDTLKAKYQLLGAKPEFRNLKKSTPLYAIWDDHDYGENDAGRHYPFKAESKEIFMDFWGVPQNSDRRKHAGIYGVEYLKKENLTVQLVLLDTRTFRDELKKRPETDTLNGHKNDYIPYAKAETDSTFLGAQQWQWLEQTLKQTADIRIVASSNQFSHVYNGWESWTNVPHEQARMIDLIKKTKAEGVIFISGDVHWGEISKMEIANGYPIYDVTSSGITETWDIIEPNDHRIGKVIPQNNIGNIKVTKSSEVIEIELALIDSTKVSVVKHQLTKRQIAF